MIKLKAKVGVRGQIVIPKPLRDSLQIRSGDSIYLVEQSGSVVLEKEAGGMKILQDFLNEVKTPRKLKKIDWNNEYEERFIKGLDL